MIRALAAIVVGSLALGCVVAPPVHLALQSLEAPSSWPYSRVFGRLALASLAVLLVVFRRRLEMARVVEAFRWGRPRERAAAFGVGLLLSGATAFAVIPVLVARGTVVWSGMTAEAVALKVAVALPAAALVSILEEGFFRVLIFEGLRRRVAPVVAAVLSSAFYAWLHFLSPDRAFTVEAWSPTTGFEYFGRVLARFGLPAVQVGVLGLFCMGLVLCATLAVTRSVPACVGLHAGWFVVAKAAVFLTNPAADRPFPPGLSERYLMVGQPATWLSIATVAGSVLLLRRVLTVAAPSTQPDAALDPEAASGGAAAASRQASRSRPRT